MMLPPVIRIFFAIDLSSETKKILASYIRALKNKTNPATICWSKPANLHITLQFLSQVATSHLPMMMDETKKRIAQMASGKPLVFGPPFLLPTPFRPRVIALNVSPQAELAALSALIGEGIKAASYSPEDRPFLGHLTLGRITHANDLHFEFLAQCEPPILDEVIIKEVALFRSEPQATSSKYTLLERMALRGAH